MYITFWKLQINEVFVFICLVKVIVIFGVKVIFSSVVLSVFDDRSSQTLLKKLLTSDI